MLRSAVAASVAVVAVVALGACGDDGAGASDPLAERVLAIVRADGDVVDGDLDDVDARCPRVEDPAPGDRATCVLRLGDGRRVEVDVEFNADGSLTVVEVVDQ